MKWLPGRKWLAAAAALGVVLGCGASVVAEEGADAAYVAHVAAEGLDSPDAAVRQAALARAHEEAMALILRRLTATRDHGRLPVATGPNVAGYVAETTPLPGGERVMVALRADAVRQMLQGFAVPYLDERAPLLAVVPIHETVGGSALWSGPNPWLDTWAHHPGDVGLVPVTTPLADFGDVEAINPAEARAGDAASLHRLARRYDAAGTLVAVWRETGAGAEVLLSVLSDDGWRGQVSLQLDSGAEPSAEAVDASLEAVARLWTEHRLRPSYDGPTSALRVAAEFVGLGDWIVIRQALEEAPVVARFEVPLVSGTGAEFVIHHHADLVTLQAELSGLGLLLEPGVGVTSGWRLRLTAGTPSPAQEEPASPSQAVLHPQALTAGAAVPTLPLDP